MKVKSTPAQFIATTLFLIICTGVVAAGSNIEILTGPDVTHACMLIQSRQKPIEQPGRDLIITQDKTKSRFLLRFDLNRLPREKPREAVLMIYMGEMVRFRDTTLNGFRVLADWDVASATWLKRTDKAFWSQAGGDIAPSPTCLNEIRSALGLGWVVLRGQEFTNLVRQWIVEPQSNHGLLFSGYQSEGKSFTKQFRGPTWPDPVFRPKLILNYGKGEIDPAKFGYVDELECQKIPLREEAKLLEKDVAASNEELKRKYARVITKLEQIKKLNQATFQKIDGELKSLRIELMQHNWPGKSVVIWPVGPWDHLLRGQMPTEAKAEMFCRMPQNAYSEMTVAVTNLKKTPYSVEVAIQELPAGLAQDKITVRASYWVRAQISPAKAICGKPSIWVDDALPRLRENRYMDLKPGQTRRLWLTLCSKGVRSGKYSFRVLLRGEDGKTLYDIPAQVEVSSVRLQPEPQLRVFTYSYLSNPNFEKKMGVSPEVAIRDQKEHWQNSFVLHALTPRMGPSGKIIGTANFENTKKILHLIPDAKELIFFWLWDDKSGSLGTFGKAFPWMSDMWKQAFVNWVTQWRDGLKKENIGYDRFIMYPFDESYDNCATVCSNKTEVEVLEETARELKVIDPKIRLFVNPNFWPGGLVCYERLAKYTDVWCPGRNLYDAETIKWPYYTTLKEMENARVFYEKQKSAGKVFYMYQCDGPTKGLDVNEYYRKFIWLAWLNNATGLSIWSYNDVRGTTVWDDFENNGTGGDFAMVYTLHDAPRDIPRQLAEELIPSRRWEMWRTAIQEYFLLQQVKRSFAMSEKELRKLVFQVVRNGDKPIEYENANKLLMNLLEKNN